MMADLSDLLSKRSELMISMWAKSSCYPTNDQGDQFVEICSKGDLDELKRFYSSCSNKEQKEIIDYGGNRALRMTAKNKHLDCVKELIENCNADIHSSSDYLDNISLISSHDAIISHACLNNDIPMLRYLLSKHPKKLCTDYKILNTTSDILQAVKQGHLEVIRMLYQHGECEDSPLCGIFFGTPTKKLVPLFELFIDELGHQPNSNEWNCMLTKSVANDNLEALEWLMKRCPMKDSLDLKRAVGQACFGENTYGPHPCLDYLIDICGCVVSVKMIGNGFSSSTYSYGKRVDRTPFLRWLEHKGIKLKGNHELINKARSYNLNEVVEWLTS